MNRFSYLYRIFLKHSLTNSIGILGLSIGIAISVLIFHWASNELSYDQFNTDSDKTYRLTFSAVLNGESVTGCGLTIPVYQECLNRFPEIEDGIILHPDFGENIGIEVGSELIYEDQVAIADTNFFTFFDYQLLAGSPRNGFNTPDKVVVSKKLATKLFQNKNPVGEQIKAFGQVWQVGAVMDNMPVNSHIKVNILFPLWGIDWMQDNERDYNIYFKVGNQTNHEQLCHKIGMLKTGFRFEELIQKYELQSLKDIRFGTHILYDFVRAKMDKSTVYIVVLLAFVILVLACINFTNLFLSTLFVRTKNVKLRKIIGANRRLILFEFLAETFTYVLCAAIIGIFFAVLTVSKFNSIANAEIFINFRSYEFYGFIFIVVAFVCLLSGLYPAFLMTKTQSSGSSEENVTQPKISSVQKVLMIAQFTSSIIILIFLVVIQKQLHYSRDIALGYQTSNIITLQPYGGFETSYDEIRQQLIKHPAILEVTATSRTPIGGGDVVEVKSQMSQDEVVLTETFAIKDNYLDLMEMEVLSGDNLEVFNDSASTVLINQTLQARLNLADPIGQVIKIGNNKLTIKGIIADIKKSSYQTADPQLYYKLSEVKSWNRMLVKTTANEKDAIKHLETIWHQHVHNRPFEYNFLDQVYENQYKSDEQVGAIAKVGFVIALLISILGIFAIVKFSMQCRTKEIGIRKANGATVFNLLVKVSERFMVWIAISVLVAIPTGYIITNEWLDKFAYRTELSWWVFLMASLFVFLIALLTVSWQSWKAASRNPVEALRYE